MDNYKIYQNINPKYWAQINPRFGVVKYFESDSHHNKGTFETSKNRKALALTILGIWVAATYF